jgi:hypothetical protein
MRLGFDPVIKAKAPPSKMDHGFGNNPPYELQLKP